MDRNDLQDNGQLDHQQNISGYTCYLGPSQKVQKKEIFSTFFIEMFEEIKLVRKFQKLLLENSKNFCWSIPL